MGDISVAILIAGERGNVSACVWPLLKWTVACLALVCQSWISHHSPGARRCTSVSRLLSSSSTRTGPSGTPGPSLQLRMCPAGCRARRRTRSGRGRAGPGGDVGGPHHPHPGRLLVDEEWRRVWVVGNGTGDVCVGHRIDPHPLGPALDRHLAAVVHDLHYHPVVTAARAYKGLLDRSPRGSAPTTYGDGSASTVASSTRARRRPCSSSL